MFGYNLCIEYKLFILLINHKNFTWSFIMYDEKENKNMMDEFHLSKERYNLLFRYENLYGIFRPREFVPDYMKSNYYDLISTTEINEDSFDDVLKDLSFFVRAGRLMLCTNDVVSIKINGLIKSFRYCGAIAFFENSSLDFSEVKNFLQEEKEQYIRKIHTMNCVLSLTEAQLLPLENTSLNQKKFFHIEKETFYSPNLKGRIVSNFSLLTLGKHGIINVNPYQKPFVMLNNILYYFYRLLEKDHNAVLLMSRQELEMVRDFYTLNNEKLVI